MSASRIARLTLFSGPQCSLCEVAKAELAKVKKQREFVLDVINIHDKGQEKWKKKYVYWIPALHLDGTEIAKGRWDASTVLEALKQRETNVHHFIVDTTSSIHSSAPSFGPWHACLYDRVPGVALGEESDRPPSPARRDLRLCFNCGSPDHPVASCPEPIDRQLVSLSRQLFNFLHPEPGRHEFTRLHLAEGWKQQRLGWLGSYKPGVIRSHLLRDALGLREGDPGNAVEWLRNMAHWGYPPGWVGCRDPTELAYDRIMEDGTEGQAVSVECDPFTIFEGAEDVEKIDLRRLGPPLGTAGCSPASSVDQVRTRWATYPGTYFSPTVLSVYNGTPLDQIAASHSQASMTFTPERRALWERVLSGGLGTLSAPPWRMPGTFGASSCSTREGATVEELAPRPPPTTPPPLPPDPGSPLHAFTPQRCLAANKESASLSRVVTDDTLVVDMDVSDESE